MNKVDLFRLIIGILFALGILSCISNFLAGSTPLPIFAILIIFMGVGGAFMIFYRQEDHYHEQGLARLKQGDYQKAIKYYNQALRINPNYAEAYNNRAIARSALGEYQAAIEDCDRALQINPNLPQAYYNRGVAICALGDYQAAIQDYDLAIRLNPNFYQAYYMRGDAHSALGDYQAANKDYDRAVQIKILPFQAPPFPRQ